MTTRTRRHPATIYILFFYALVTHVPKVVWERVQRRMENPPIQRLPSTRRRSLTNPPPEPSRWYRRRAQRTHTQSQSSFFTKLPREIRQQIYELVLVSDGGRPLHVSVTAHRLCGMCCRYQGPSSDCAGWRHGEECWGPVNSDGNTVPWGDGDRDSDGSGCRAVGVLCCCRQMYAEAVDTLYARTVLNIRQTTALAALGMTMRPQRLRAFRTLHIDTVILKNASGMLHSEPRWPLAVTPHWDQAWKIVAAMEGLRELRVSLTGSTLGAPWIDGNILRWLRPMMKVRVPLFQVVVYWPWPLDPVLGELGDGVPFTIEVKLSSVFQHLDLPLDDD